MQIPGEGGGEGEMKKEDNRIYKESVCLNQILGYLFKSNLVTEIN